MRTFAWRISGRLVVYLHGASAPAADEWAQMAEAMRTLKKLSTFRVMVYSAGGMPTGRQREELAGLLQGTGAPTALLASTLQARFIGWMMRFFNKRTRVFSPRAFVQACDFLGLKEAERGLVFEALSEMASKMDVSLRCQYTPAQDDATPTARTVG